MAPKYPQDEVQTSQWFTKPFMIWSLPTSPRPSLCIILLAPPTPPRQRKTCVFKSRLAIPNNSVIQRALPLTSAEALCPEHSLPLFAWLFPSFRAHSGIPDSVPQPVLHVLPIYSHMLWGHLVGFIVLDSNYLSPQLNWKLLKGRAVSVLLIAIHSQCL